MELFGYLIAFVLIVYAVVWGFTIAVALVGAACILAKGALCALWHKLVVWWRLC